MQISLLAVQLAMSIIVLSLVALSLRFQFLSRRATGRVEQIKRQWEKDHGRPWGA